MHRDGEGALQLDGVRATGGVEASRLLSLPAPPPLCSFEEGRLDPSPPPFVNRRVRRRGLGRLLTPGGNEWTRRGKKSIVLMSAGLVIAIWGIAEGRLVDIFSNALDTVCGGIGC